MYQEKSKHQEKSIYRAALALALGLLAAPALAHEPRIGPHGGPVVDAGDYHLEVVTQGKAMEVFVSDMADKPISAKDFKALAILAVEGKATRLPLAAVADGSRLAGAAEVALPKQIKGAVQLISADGKTTIANFK